MSKPVIPSTVMIIDDTPANLKLLQHILKREGYRVVSFPGGAMALQAASRNPPDLILLDIKMPVMDGYEVCSLLKKDPVLKNIPVLFISANTSTNDKVAAFSAGGVDYITKPFQEEVVQARIKTHLNMRKLQVELKSKNENLLDLVAVKVQEIEQGHLAIIDSISDMVESRDEDTGGHIHRTKSFCRILAEDYVLHHYFNQPAKNSDFITNIFNAASLHDIGKFGISDNILLKPGKLTKDEFEIMKTHVLIGVRTLSKAYERNPGNKFLKMGIDLTKTHHEKFDGSGYPYGLVGEQIPLCGRIMALSDVYDALRSPRSYKPAFDHEKSGRIIIEDSGTHFDPELVESFLRVESIMDKVYNLYSNSVIKEEIIEPELN